MIRQFALLEEAVDRLEAARSSQDGRSAVSLHEGEPCVLRQTVTALVSGQHMDIQHPPAEAWILLLEGRVSVLEGEHAEDGHDVRAGALLQLPHGPQRLLAVEDSVVLLTVAMGDRPPHANQAPTIRLEEAS